MITTYTEYFCLQCQSMISSYIQHLENNPDHALINVVTTSGLVDNIEYDNSGYSSEIVAPNIGTSTLVISGFPTIEDAINYIVASGVEGGVPTQNISGFTTIEDAIGSLAGDITSSKRISFPFGSNNTVGIESITTSYTTARSFIFPGTSAMGMPSCIEVIACMSGGNSEGFIRLYDLTNNQIICEKASIYNTDPSIIDLGQISNIPSDKAMFEIQLKHSGARKIMCHCLCINF